MSLLRSFLLLSLSSSSRRSRSIRLLRRRLSSSDDSYEDDLRRRYVSSFSRSDGPFDESIVLKNQTNPVVMVDVLITWKKVYVHASIMPRARVYFLQVDFFLSCPSLPLLNQNFQLKRLVRVDRERRLDCLSEDEVPRKDSNECRERVLPSMCGAIRT